MLRIIVFASALALVAIGSLNAVRSPAWAPWQVAVLAGEFGHWLAALPLVLGAATWRMRRGRGGWTALSLGACGIAFALLLKPAFEAWRIAGRLPAQLEARFGPAQVSRPAFSAVALFFGRRPELVALRTMEVAPGLPMDFYGAVRGENRRPAPCVVLVHGGGWDGGDRKQLAPFNHWLARRGYSVAAISYRLAPQFIWPAQRDDVLAAIAFLKQHAAELEIDASRLVLVGRSAGAQIAAVVAYTAADPAIRGFVDLYGPVDLNFGYAHAQEDDVLKSPALMRQFLGGTPGTARANYDSASAWLHATPQSPPTLLLHGENDALVWHRHSVRLDEKLATLGVPRLFVSLPWATHAFDYNLHGPGGQLTLFAVEAFLARVTQ